MEENCTAIREMRSPAVHGHSHSGNIVAGTGSVSNAHNAKPPIDRD